MDVKTLRYRIHHYFNTKFGFRSNFYESECYENELLFTLLICNTFDKVRKIKENKKVQQRERNMEISFHILNLKDQTPGVAI